MENYSKGKNVEEPLEFEKLTIPNLPEDVMWMQVKGGTRMRDILEPALEAYSTKATPVLWSGAGASLGKAISCAEVMKRKFPDVHQFNHIGYRRCQEFWDPKLDGLDPLVVNRDIPTIHILLTKEPVNQDRPGYQPPMSSDKPKPRPKQKKFSKSKKSLNPEVVQEMENYGMRFDKKKKTVPR